MNPDNDAGTTKRNPVKDDVVVNTDDVQRLLLRASKAKCVKHVLVRFKTASAGRKFLNALYDEVSWGNGKGKFQDHEIAVGITFSGLETLDVLDGYLHIFRRLAPAFAEGAVARAAEYLGDVGINAARHWDVIFTSRQAHAVVTIHGTPENNKTEWENSVLIPKLEHLSQYLASHSALHGQHLPQPEAEDEGSTWQKPNTIDAAAQPAIDGRIETDKPIPWHAPNAHIDPPDADPAPVWLHFGYRDGLTSNRIRTRKSQETAINTHEPGELLLGEPRNTGDNPWSLIDRSERIRRFFKHSSFGVVRQVQQDERGFRAFVNSKVQELQREPKWQNSTQLSAYIRAKLCGRWPNGQVVRTTDTPQSLPQRYLEDGNFTYYKRGIETEAEIEKEKESNTNSVVNMNNDTKDASALAESLASTQSSGHDTQPETEVRELPDDTKGLGCPFSSHIRRMNPRSDDGIQTHRRPLFRRGIPYGPWFKDSEPDDTTRGLLGHFFCSDLQNQFEHLLGEWSDRRPLGIGGDRHQKDPLIGSHTSPYTKFAINRQAAVQTDHEQAINLSTNIQDFKPFVRTLGTVYCFYPSNAALKDLGSDEPWVPKTEEQWLTR